MSYQQVTILGNLGRDPETKDINGQTLATFSVATSKKIKEEERTEWHRIKCWGQTAEFVAKYLTKGRTVLVIGELQTRSWEKDGQKHFMTEVNAFKVEAVGPRPAGNDTPVDTTTEEDDDLPF